MVYEQNITTNLSDFIGEWVIIVDKKVVQHGENLKNIFKKAKENYPNRKFLIGKVPEKGNLIL